MGFSLLFMVDFSPAARMTIDNLSSAIRATANAGDHLAHRILEEIRTMSAELDRLTSEVQQSRDATDSAITLISGLADQIRALQNDPAALAALADSLDADQTRIAEAVTANTPAGGGDTAGGGTDEDTLQGGQA